MRIMEIRLSNVKELLILELEAIKFAILFSISVLLLTLNVIYNVGIIPELFLTLCSVLGGIGYLHTELQIIKRVRKK